MGGGGERSKPTAVCKKGVRDTASDATDGWEEAKTAAPAPEMPIGGGAAALAGAGETDGAAASDIVEIR